MNAASDHLQLRDVFITLAPDSDSAIHITHPTEPPEQPDHSRNILRMVAASKESFKGRSEIGLFSFQFQTCLMVAQRNIEIRQVHGIILFVVRPGISP